MLPARPGSFAYLWLCMAVGLALALAAIARPASSALREHVPDGAVAVVNGQFVPRLDYDAAVRAIRARAKSEAEGDADKQAALAQMIDEELLIERALELGMERADSGARRALQQAVFNAERSAAYARTPSDDELERFYRELGSTLQRPGKLHVRQLLVRAQNAPEFAAARARAQEARRRLLAGEPLETLQRELADPPERPLPDRFASVAELYDLLGPVAIEPLLKLAPGEVSDVIGSGTMLRVLVLVDKQPPAVPPLAEIRDELIHHYRNQAADQAYAAKLAALRANARIVRRQPLP